MRTPSTGIYMSDYIGIDYGHGLSNVDKATGIRYGVIGQGTVGAAWYDIEPDYGEPHCPAPQQ